MDYVHAYSNGNEAEVWDRLCALESRRDQDLSEALRWVATEAMRRVRRNIERLIPRWEARGHKFGYDWAGACDARYVEKAPPLLGNPTAADLESLDAYERARGPIPIALRAFYEVIGAVNFVGRVANGWPDSEILDPLQVEAFSQQLPALLSEEAWDVVICPDHSHKYFISGADAFTVQLPSQSFDPVLRFESCDLELDGAPLTFGRYLRHSILNRGGIGLVAGWNDDAPDPTLVAFLTQGLEPF